MRTLVEDVLNRVRGRASADGDRAWSLAERVRAAQGGNDRPVLYTPDRVIARMLPCTQQGDAAETAYWDAVQLLQHEEIWVVARWHAGQVAFIAAPGDRFQPDGNPARTALAQALPGHPLHRGDGGYGTSLVNGVQAVVVVKNGTLQMSLGSEREVQRFASDCGVRMVTADPEAAEEWTPYRLAQMRHQRKAALMIATSGGAAALLASAAWLAATLWQQERLEEKAIISSQAAIYTQDLDSQLAEAVRQPLLLHLAHLQKLRGLKMTFGEQAHLLRYEVGKDGTWRWTAVVPDWANDQSLAPFGSGIRLAASPGRPGTLLATGAGR